MKKIIILIIFLLTAASFIYQYGFNDAFSGRGKKGKEKIESLKEGAHSAENKYRQDMKSAEKVGYSYSRLGEAYLDRHDWTPAIDSLKKAIEYGRSGSQDHFLLAVAYANRARGTRDAEDIKKAELHYKTALELNHNFYQAMYGLAVLNYYIKGAKKDAVKQLTELIDSNPEYYRARFALARIYYTENRPARALRIYEEMYDILKKKPDTSLNAEYRKRCNSNILRIQSELQGTSR